MLLMLKKKYVIPICIIVVVATISFITCSVILNSNVSAEDFKGEDINVASIEEAGQLAGYKIAVPHIIPSGFEKTTNILVSQFGHFMGGPESRAIEQEWRYSDKHSFIALVQTPRLSIPIEGERVKIGELEGTKVFIEAYKERPELIALYWIDDNMGYSLCGTLTGQLNEQDITNIAASVSTN